jgi:hypothetical protein
MVNEKALVLKSSLDFDKLMAIEGSSRPSSRESGDSIKSESVRDLDLTRLGVDGDIYFMELTTPGLQTPHLSPKDVGSAQVVLEDGETVLEEVDPKAGIEQAVGLKAPVQVKEKSVLEVYQKESKSNQSEHGSFGAPKLIVDGVVAI